MQALLIYIKMADLRLYALLEGCGPSDGSQPARNRTLVSMTILTCHGDVRSLDVLGIE
jgi:hypothetical protein